ncbi:MAG: tetratricopeptide repeat protein [Bacteroidia bacterium]|nr:tetratricopeptide repeat protein [Bacteroidia bacterium]
MEFLKTFMVMYFRLPTLFLFLVSFSLYAQKIELINSGEVIEKGKILYDSGRFDDAVLTYKAIDRRDTNYVYMLSELAMAYLGAEDYPNAINAAEEGITLSSIYKAHLYRSLAIALDRGGHFEKSVETFNKAIAEYPFDYSLHYNLGITYFNHKEYEKAGTKFFETLSLNPFHGGSHFNLGKLMVLQGRKTQALMALGIYMGVSPSDNGALVYLEHVLKNEIPEEGSVETNEPNHFARLDQMIRAKLAMDKGFKSNIPADVAVVKQFELFFDQMPKGIDNPDDPWLSFYLSTYQALKAAGHNETFIYHIVTSAPLDKAEKWRKKNDKQLKDFYAAANKALGAHRTPKLYPPIDKDKPVSFWYSESNKLEAIGNQISDSKRTGRWVYFYDNGERSAEGAYTANGEKTGVWTYYYSTGRVKSIEDQESGEIKTYNVDGEPVERYFTKNDVVNGDVEIFYRCGMIQRKTRP